METLKKRQQLTSGLAQAGVHLVGQFAEIRKFSSRPSVSGNPRLPPSRFYVRRKRRATERKSKI